MPKPEPTTRLSFTVDRELNNRFDRAVRTWGVKSELLRRVMEMVVDAAERDGEVIIGTILAGQMELKMRKNK